MNIYPKLVQCSSLIIIPLNPATCIYLILVFLSFMCSNDFELFVNGCPECN